MQVVTGIFALLLILIVLTDGFETVILPRRPARRMRLTRLFYRFTWKFWSMRAHKIKSNERREYYLSFFGPLSLILLLGLWAGLLIFSFGLLQWSFGSVVNAPEKTVTFLTDLYMSGTTFFTIGLGDVVPRSGFPRLLVVIEGGLGFAFLALIIGYVPVIYQAFSRREAQISLLDAHASSPPSALEFLRRHIADGNLDELLTFVRTWEEWCAELLESHLSYAVLIYYRSQHDRQSWVAALTTVLDVSAFMIANLQGNAEQIGRFTFAIARHAAVDLAQAWGVPPQNKGGGRLTDDSLDELRALFQDANIPLSDLVQSREKLRQLHSMYEPYLDTLATYLLTPLPDWIPTQDTVDDWQTSPWDHFALTSQRPLHKQHRIAHR